MAIPALSLDEVMKLNIAGRACYFDEYARYFEDSPEIPYAIRVGSKTFHSNDTLDLKMQFINYLKRETPAFRWRQIGKNK